MNFLTSSRKNKKKYSIAGEIFCLVVATGLLLHATSQHRATFAILSKLKLYERYAVKKWNMVYRHKENEKNVSSYSYIFSLVFCTEWQILCILGNFSFKESCMLKERVFSTLIVQFFKVKAMEYHWSYYHFKSAMTILRTFKLE